MVRWRTGWGGGRHVRGSGAGDRGPPAARIGSAGQPRNKTHPLPAPQGESCVEVAAVYDTSKVATSPRYDQWYEPLGEETHTFSKKVRFVFDAAMMG